MNLTITGLPNGTVDLTPGEVLVFGRGHEPDHSDRGFIAVNPSISREHGVICATNTGWTVKATGTIYTFTVLDRSTPSRLVLPRNAGPVDIPFEKAAIIIEIGDDDRHRYSFMIDTDTDRGWESGWTNILRDHEARHGIASHTQTSLADEHKVTWTNRKGDELRWYQTLVALCEPRLTPPFKNKVPSVVELAKRLGVGPDVIEKVHLPRIAVELNLVYAGHVRTLAAALAINQGLVTVSDLNILQVEP